MSGAGGSAFEYFSIKSCVKPKASSIKPLKLIKFCFDKQTYLLFLNPGLLSNIWKYISPSQGAMLNDRRSPK